MHKTLHITGVVLAAGSSSRMGATNKLLLDYHGTTILETVIDNVSCSQVDNVVVITGYDHQCVQGVLLKRCDDRISVIYNEHYIAGRAESIKCAVHNVSKTTDAILFMVGDKPTVSTSLIDRAIEAFQNNDSDLQYIMTPEGRGHPIIFARNLFDDLLKLDGDIVGGTLIERHEDKTVKLFDDEMQPDIDCEEDYSRLISDKSLT